MKITKELATIFLIQITEVLGFSLILPFLPFYAQTFGASPIVIGMILTSFSLFQFISAPIMGRLSDHYGRKPMLVLSQISTFISFVILGFANSLWMIFLSRIVDGLFGSNYTIAQAYLSDISSDADRTKIFALSGVAFGIGFLIGPGIGGYLSTFSYSLPAFVAAGVSFFTIMISLFILPETIKRRKSWKEISNLSELGKLFHFNDFRKFLRSEKTAPKLWQFFAYVSSFVVWTSTFALYGERQLGIGPKIIGYMFMYVGFISIILRGGLLPKLLKRFTEKRLKYAGMLSILFAMIGAVFMHNWMLYLVLSTFFSFGSGIIRPVMYSQISKSAPKDEQGAALGVANSMGSIAQIIGPLMGGFMINYFFPGSLGILSAAILIIGIILMIREDMKSEND